ncbi:MAG TPA: homoserine O-acetyltransferase [Steroidobacteraceae bacterium]|nr:homoserine O-acetyltransferase [Steroidobacteraceae bacterium]
MSAARKTLKLTRPFEMRRGGALQGVEIAYETWGDMAFCYDNAIMIFTGLSPSAHAASSTEDPSPGWWEDMIGPGRPIDTRRFFVICVNSLGSPFGSTSPASINPGTGHPYRLTFPVLTVEDIARTGYEVAASLGVKKLAAVIGPSLGGMTVLAYCALFPGSARSVVSISASARSVPFAIAMRSLQREIIRRDPAWRDGNYTHDAMPVTGMQLARKLGMITYRSAKEWALRFGRERANVERKPGDPFGIDFEVESYLENHAAKFTGQYDPNCYLYISRAMDLFDLADHGGSVAEALRRFTVDRALIIGVETDLLFPIEQQQELADGLAAGGKEVHFARLSSLQGHDSFLVDMDRFRPVIADFLSKL